jgi:hypothetical protein
MDAFTSVHLERRKDKKLPQRRRPSLDPPDPDESENCSGQLAVVLSHATLILKRCYKNT